MPVLFLMSGATLQGEAAGFIGQLVVDAFLFEKNAKRRVYSYDGREIREKLKRGASSGRSGRQTGLREASSNSNSLCRNPIYPLLDEESLVVPTPQ